MSRTFRKNLFSPLQPVTTNYYVQFSLTDEPIYTKIFHPNDLKNILTNSISGPQNRVVLPKWDFLRKQRVRIFIKRNCINSDMHIKIAIGLVSYLDIPENWTDCFQDDKIVAIEGEATQIFLFCYRQCTSNIERAKMLVDTAIHRQLLAKELKEKAKRLKQLKK